MRNLTIACLVAFALGLGVTVAYRMHTEAMAVVVGVLCGVLASVPVSVLILYATRQGQKAAPAAMPPQVAPQPPPVIVLAPGMANHPGLQWPQQPALPPGPPARAPREFTIIGDEE